MSEEEEEEEEERRPVVRLAPLEGSTTFYFQYFFPVLLPGASWALTL